MKALSPGDRPREKLLTRGATALGDNELVALVLGSGRRGAGVLDVANELLASRGGLHGIARGTCGDLARVEGIGHAKAAQLLAALELGRRALSRAPEARVRITTARDAAALLLPSFGSRAVEQFGIVLLDARSRVMRTLVVATGTLNTTIVHPRDVFREAMLGDACSVIAFHNHPSGDPAPSDDDALLTRRLAAAGVLMGIELVDHIVLGDARYFSFREAGSL